MWIPALLALSSIATPATGAQPFDLSSRSIVATFHAEGAQVYTCAATRGGALAWSFREPIATLLEDGKTVGRHFAGPRWALDDGSLVQGRVTGTLAGAAADAVPILKLDVVRNSGQGRLATVTTVYRLNTRSGALQGACSVAGGFRSVAYSAEYVFAR